MTVSATPEAIFHAACKRWPGAAIELTLERKESTTTRFADSLIHQNMYSETTVAILRLHHKSRTITAVKEINSPGQAADFLEECDFTLNASPEDHHWPGIQEQEERVSSPVGGLNVDVPDDFARAKAVQKITSLAADLGHASGYLRTVAKDAVFLNSAGYRRSGNSTSVVIDAIVTVDGNEAAIKNASSTLAGLALESLTRVALKRARALRNPVTIAPGSYEVVLAPCAVVDILDYLNRCGFNAKTHLEGRSCLRLNEQQFDKKLTVVDDPSKNVTFDRDGTSKEEIFLVRDGVPVSLVHDRRTATAMGLSSTGHAGAGSDQWGPLASDLRVKPGESDVVAETKLGVFIGQFWYTRPLDPKRLLMTGTTRNGVWLIEDGRLTRAVKNMRFTESYLDALAPGRLLGVGEKTETIPAEWDDHTSDAPSLRLASWRLN
ncbi:MAG: TldD/PmbA family protein [Terriglobales bacterium]